MVVASTICPVRNYRLRISPDSERRRAEKRADNGCAGPGIYARAGGSFKSDKTSVRNHVVIRQSDSDHVETRLRQRPYAHLMEADLEILPVNVNAQVAVIVVIVFCQDEVVSPSRRCFLPSRYLTSAPAWGSPAGVPFCGLTRVWTLWPPSPQTIKGTSISLPPKLIIRV